MVSLATPLVVKGLTSGIITAIAATDERWLIDIAGIGGESFCSITARFGTIAIIGNNEAFTAAIEIVFNNTIALALFASMPDLTCVDSLQGDAIQGRAIGVGDMNAQQVLTATIAIFSL